LTKTNAKSNFPESVRKQETRKLISIEKQSLKIWALFVLASIFFWNGPITFGLLLGGCVAILNFRWLWRIGEKIIFEKKWIHIFHGFIQFFVLVIVIFLILWYARINPVAFLVGISTLMMGMLVIGVRGLLSGKGAEKNND
jgi:hypothetical protein